MINLTSPGADDRWEAYLSATVAIRRAENWLDLTGPDAVERWPFDGPVFALTAWDPAGQVRSREVNDANNELLRSELDELGVEVIDSAGFDGSSVTGLFVDLGFVVSGANQSEVLRIASRFRQEAVYRIAARTLAVVSVDGSVAESRRRR